MKARQSPIQGFREPILPAFEGFPYLLTQIIPTLYHITLLPKAMGFTKLRVLARRQARVNKLPTWLVHDKEICIFVKAYGSDQLSDSIPRGRVVTGKLECCEQFPASSELKRPSERLIGFEWDSFGPMSCYR